MSQAAEPKIRGAVVGAGHMGQYHILALAEIWGVELVGVVDADFAKAQRVAAPYGARAYRDHRELAGQIDFATVAVCADIDAAICGARAAQSAARDTRGNRGICAEERGLAAGHSS